MGVSGGPVGGRKDHELGVTKSLAFVGPEIGILGRPLVRCLEGATNRRVHKSNQRKYYTFSARMTLYSIVQVQ